jgi:N-acetylmuramoyl-L-alanine amidase
MKKEVLLMKLKQFYLVLSLFVLLFLLISCHNDVDLDTNIREITLTEGDQYEIDYFTTRKDGVSFKAANTDVVFVNEDGIIEAISEGETTVRISLVADENIYIDITVTVLKKIELSVSTLVISLLVGDQQTLEYVSNDDVIFNSNNESIITIDEQGLLTAIQAGETTVTVTSVYDSTKTVTVSILVVPVAEHVLIQGESKINIGTNQSYELLLDPIDSGVHVTWHVSDSELASISEDGILTAYDVGTLTLFVQSSIDESVLATFQVEIFNTLVVKASSTLNDELLHDGIIYHYGERLFSNLSDALLVANNNTTLFVLEGNYAEDLEIHHDGITLHGVNQPSFSGLIEVKANHFSIIKFVLTNHAKLISQNQSYFKMASNIIENISHDETFLYLANMQNIEIVANTFHLNQQDAIKIDQFKGHTAIISNNTIKHALHAIFISVSPLANQNTNISVTRNDIDHIEVGITIENESNIGHAYARFNAVTNYTLFAAQSHFNSTVEFTLNYWGLTDLDLAYFQNIDSLYLRGHYASKNEIISEAQYNPSLPVKIIITSFIEEIDLGETFTITYDLLPMDLVTDRIRFITSNPDVLIISQSGTITPVKSGQATITVRSSVNFSINDQMTVVVRTEPGIELKPSNIENNLFVGDTFTLSATPFPIDIKDESVFFFSSDDDVATIDEHGVVTTHQEGVVTFSAWLLSDETVTNHFTVQVYPVLEDHNLLDLLTLNQVNYAYPREWLALGVGHNYKVNTYESVSRYHFGEIPINTSKIVPVFYAIRPGEPMAQHPVGITPFNPYNVYWVVIHDTANTSPGSGALAHANYLYNNTINQTALWVSWHYTIDDVYIYQHVPEIERAFHAGDGSALPGQHSVYLGGGNRNGVGIEMAVNQDSDMYRTWQRTAKLAADILVRYDLPREHMKYHRDFSGKTCPNTLINAGLMPQFELFADIEYRVRKDFHDAEIIFESHHHEYLDDHGRIIKLPDRALTVSYTITVTHDDVTTSRTFYTYLPGTLT